MCTWAHSMNCVWHSPLIIYYDDEYNYCSVLSNLCIMTSIFPKFQCVTHQSSDNFSMKHVKRYFISAALIICLLYNGLFTPSNTIVQRTINIVTEKVKSVENCKKYILSFILNGKYVQPTAKTSQPELTCPSCFSDCHVLREGHL